MTSSAERKQPRPELQAFLAVESRRVDVALAELTAEALPRLAPSLREPVSYALGTHGKRLRPILCRTAYRALRGGEPEALVRFACALEILHTYSLVHDDLPCMDNDDLRRGRPTVHRVHGTAVAILAGAALIPLAVRVLDTEGAALGLNSAERSQLVTELCMAAGATGMVGGQVLDLQGEEEPVDGAGLEAIHRAKTGALLATSLRLGGLAARATVAELRALTEYGEALGLAFQITDDILDVSAESAALGKTAGKDRSAGKATYPALYGLDGARSLARERGAAAVTALQTAGISSPELEMLARYVVERRR